MSSQKLHGSVQLVIRQKESRLHVQGKAQVLVGNKDYTETQWDPSEDGLKSGGKHTAPVLPRKPGEYLGLKRMNKCSSQGMGLKVSCVCY